MFTTTRYNCNHITQGSVNHLNTPEGKTTHFGDYLISDLLPVKFKIIDTDLQSLLTCKNIELN